MKRVSLLKVAGVFICAVALGLHLQNVFDGYGVKSCSLHLEVLAQSDTSGDGGGTSGDGGGTSGGGVTCYSKIQVEPDKDNKTKWKSTFCNGCCPDFGYKFEESSTCTPNGNCTN